MTLSPRSNMLASLQMARHDDPSLGTVEQCRAVLRNMERIITDPKPRE